MDNLTKILEAIGLTDGEQSVYLALLKLGESTSGPISKESGISASKVYQVINRLIKKGLVGEFERSGIHHFTPMHPNTIIDYINNKENKLEELRKDVQKSLPNFIYLFEEKAQATQVELHKGKQSLWNSWNSMLNELKKGEEYKIIGATYGEGGNEEESRFYTHFHNKRISKGVKARMLFQPFAKPLPITKKTAKIRYLPLNFNNPLQINIYKDVSNLVIWEPEPMIFRIKSKQVTDSFNQYFEELWKQAKSDKK